MGALLRLFSWRHGIRRPTRAALGVASIALGVALLVAIESAHHTVVASFARTAAKLAGRAALQVISKEAIGVDESALAIVRRVPGAVAAPVLQGSVTIVGHEEAPLLLFGVDLASDAAVRVYAGDAAGVEVHPLVAAAAGENAAIVTRRLADRCAFAIGSPLVLDTPRGRASLVVAGLLRDEGAASVFGGSFAVVSIATAQRWLGKPGRFDRIDVAADGVDAAALRDRLRAALGSGYSVEPVATGSPLLEEATLRLRSLVSISAIALVVGLFLVTNSVALAVTERARDVAILRAVGATRRQVVGAVVAEWTGVGLVGSAIGVALGWLLARAVAQFTAKTVNLYVLAVDPSTTELSWPVAFGGLVAGTATAALAAWIPALDATRVAPVDVLREGVYRMRRAPRFLRAFAAGAALVAAGVAAAAIFGSSFPPLAWLALATAVFVALGLCAPQATVWISRVARPALKRVFRIEGRLAAENVATHPQRAALTVVAFGGSIAMMVASASIVLSFRRASDVWMDERFPFDLSVQANDLRATLYGTAAFDESVLARVRATEGVDQAFGVRISFVPLGASEILVEGIEIAGYFDMHRARAAANDYVVALDSPQARARLERGESCYVSINLATLRGFKPGDSIELITPKGPRRFKVESTFEDLSWPAGSVVIDRGVYRDLWGDASLSFVDVRVKPGASLAAVKARIAGELRGSASLFLYEVEDLKRIARDTIDASLALANVQVVIAITIGFLGIVNTLLISVLQRSREIGLLRAVGTTRAQVRRTIALEALLIAVAGGAFGVATGLVGAAWPLHRFTLAMTGFDVPFALPTGTVALALGASLLLGALASWLPARRAASLNVLQAIAYE